MIHSKKILLGSLLGLGVFLASFTSYKSPHTELMEITDDTPVWKVMEAFGKIRINQVNTEVKGVSAEKGRDIIYNGYSTKQDGTGKTKLQSPYFKCTACHNPKKEFSNLADVNPQGRLDYAIKNDLPFLQGSSFYGIVNRTNFYNDDYQKKYGGVPGIKESYDNIRAAIQLCAVQCSQGRALEDWEMESILAFFWQQELKIKDLNLSAEDRAAVNTALQTKEKMAETVHLVEDRYLKISPAHFATQDLTFENLSPNKKSNKESFMNGKAIYERSCLHCHAEQRYAFFTLDDSRQSFKYLLNKTKQGVFHSIFKITRHGTYSLNGRKAYMPQYPIEKMSDKQLMDLRLYVENMAAGNDLSK